MRINGDKLSFYYLVGVMILGLMIAVGLLIKTWLAG